MKMFHKMFFGLVLLATVTLSHQDCGNNGHNGGGDTKPLTVSISFESEIICTNHFFGSQLTVEVLQNFAQCTNIKWVIEPCQYSHFGQNGNVLECPLGEEQCKLNKMQACVAEIYKDDGLHNAMFVACMLNTRSTAIAAPSCAQKASLDMNKINDCVNKGQGDGYCNTFFNRIQSRNPKWEPYIMFDWVNDEAADDQAKKDFTKTLCQKLKNKSPPCAACNNVH